MSEELLTLKELSEALNVPLSWCYSRSRQRGPNAMPRLKCGKYIRVKKSEVIAWLQEKQEGGEAE
jgi:predicted DNA-binding transcriptional regulator AlpA